MFAPSKLIAMDKYINTDYRIVVECRDNGKRISRSLVGRSGLISIVGSQTYLRLVKMAYTRNLEKIICKPRKGMVVMFYSK